jgi:hypothetical protein
MKLHLNSLDPAFSRGCFCEDPGTLFEKHVLSVAEGRARGDFIQ